MRARKLGLMLAVTLGVAASSAARAQAGAGAGAPPPPVAGSTNPDYTLGTADKLRVLVYNEPDLSGEFVIGADGALSLPLIGAVPAAGRPVGAVQKDVTARLANGYLLDPRVSLEVLTFRPYYILGEVNKPGEYPYSNGLTVQNAVATAQGFTYRASKRKVFVKHAGDREEKQVPLTSDLPVTPGDTIRIGERYF